MNLVNSPQFSFPLPCRRPISHKRFHFSSASGDKRRAHFMEVSGPHKDLMVELLSTVENRLGSALQPCTLPSNVQQFGNASGTARASLHLRSGLPPSQVYNTQNMAKASAHEKILSYNDVVLRQSDLDILSGPYFLNDRIIEFYFSYLTTHYSSKDILLVPPSIAFWIKECPDTESLKDFVEPLHLSQRKLIIFPINDNADVSMAEGGSHWSLLAYVKNSNVFVHHDSSEGINVSHAKRVYKSVASHVASDATYFDCSDSPKQVNGYDCGLYVLAIARAICEWYASDDGRKDLEGLQFATVKEQVTPPFVSKMRNDILELVQSLKVRP